MTFIIPNTSIRSLASKHYIYIIAVILLFSKIMLIYSCYTEKKLVYIIIAAPFNCQSSFCFKYTVTGLAQLQ